MTTLLLSLTVVYAVARVYVYIYVCVYVCMCSMSEVSELSQRYAEAENALNGVHEQMERAKNANTDDSHLRHVKRAIQQLTVSERS